MGQEYQKKLVTTCLTYLRNEAYVTAYVRTLGLEIEWLENNSEYNNIFLP